MYGAFWGDENAFPNSSIVDDDSGSTTDCSYLEWRKGLLWAIDCAVNCLSEYTINAVEHLILGVLGYVVLCLVLYRLLNRGHSLRYERGFERARRVLFVTAHPDDECMFFAPTILQLTKHQGENEDQKQCQVFLVCLSNGDNEGKGRERSEELWRACKALGIRSEHVFLYRCTLLPDDPAAKWRVDLIAKIILRLVEALDVDSLVTFDKHGVSRHGNHCSIYYAAAYLSFERMLPADCKVYTLESINLLRKYWMLFDLPLSFVLSTHRYVLRWPQRQLAMDAMRLHRTQLVWFRRLYVHFSRYMLINTYQQLDMIDLELDLTIDD